MAKPENFVLTCTQSYNYITHLPSTNEVISHKKDFNKYLLF